jgi:hypothetical protein
MTTPGVVERRLRDAAEHEDGDQLGVEREHEQCGIGERECAHSTTPATAISGSSTSPAGEPGENI